MTLSRATIAPLHKDKKPQGRRRHSEEGDTRKKERQGRRRHKEEGDTRKNKESGGPSLQPPSPWSIDHTHDQPLTLSRATIAPPHKDKKTQGRRRHTEEGDTRKKKEK